jgi:hypothetical protein
MAKEQSFDVVSQVDMQEVDNAVQQASKELKQRYDLKDSGATISLDKAAATVTVTAPTDFVGNQIIDVLGTKLVRRGVDLKALDWGAAESASGVLSASLRGSSTGSRRIWPAASTRRSVTRSSRSRSRSRATSYGCSARSVTSCRKSSSSSRSRTTASRSSTRTTGDAWSEPRPSLS